MIDEDDFDAEREDERGDYLYYAEQEKKMEERDEHIEVIISAIIQGIEVEDEKYEFYIYGDDVVFLMTNYATFKEVYFNQYKTIITQKYKECLNQLDLFCSYDNDIMKEYTDNKAEYTIKSDKKYKIVFDREKIVIFSLNFKKNDCLYN